jgi:predicted enzyme related to lactoylglutathione lyase
MSTHPQEPTTTNISITLDCADPKRLSAFWGTALRYQELAAFEHFVMLGPIHEGAGPRLALQKVPEARTLKNRMHIDIWVADIDSEVARLEAIGAHRITEKPVEEHGFRWFQLADPEGNEFCVSRA